MTKHSKFSTIQAFILNRLLMIVIALMIASLFSVLLIKGNPLTGRQTSVESKRVSATTYPHLHTPKSLRLQQVA
ncbi:hypothetical protein [Sinorhizobium fredii]|uniref:hypothetical protein n=1 Tax=Rhizobium fredii TaxID=380 RepID=UPI003514CF2F